MSNQLKIYIIHYTKLEERKRNIQSILDPFSIDYEFIESFDKEELKQLDRKEYYEDSKIKFDEKVTLWKEGQISTTPSQKQKFPVLSNT